MIKFAGVKKTYILGGAEWTLGPLDLKIATGEAVAIVGRSGSGKSTLLHLAGALTEPSAGKITLFDHEIVKMSSRALGELRNKKIGFIFQDFFLFPEFTLLENVMMPLIIAEMNKKEAEKQAEAILAEVGLIDRKDHLPRELSGGQRQRGAIARALVMNPQILFADEPTGNLDAETGKNVIALLQKLHQERKMTFLLATHDPSAAEICSRRLTIENGKVVSDVSL